MYALNFFFLPQVENIDLLTTLGWHQGKGEVFADVEEDIQNIFQIKGLNYCTGFMKFHRHLDTPLSAPGNKLPFLFGKENNPMFLTIRSACIKELSIFWNSLHCLWKGVLFGPNNGNIDFKIFEFGLYRANSERKLPAFRTATTVLLHKLPSLLAVLHSQRSIPLIQPMLLTPFINFSLKGGGGEYLKGSCRQSYVIFRWFSRRVGNSLCCAPPTIEPCLWTYSY